MELRHFSSTEVRAAKNGKQIQGYASVFNINAQLPKFQERMRPGAFTRALRQKQDVVCLFNHDSNLVLGRTSSGTLRLSQDTRGLEYECDLPNTSYANDVHELIRTGSVNGCSFAFTIPQGGDEWSEGRAKDGTYFIQRDVTDVDLIDVSPVTHPCYSGTEVSARAEDAPVELRSRVAARNSKRIVVPKQVWQRGAIGVYFESDADDFLNQRARQRMLQEILD